MQLLKLYERSTSDGTESESIPADVVHHFMLGIATHRGVGICFADNGWYPRSNDEDEQSNPKTIHVQRVMEAVEKAVCSLVYDR